MYPSSGAAALALLSFISSTSAQSVNPDCLNEVKWAKCQGATAFDCATIKVAYDWANYDKNDPNRKEIDLKLIRAPASVADPNTAKSIIVNPGGPGSSGIDFVLTGASGMLAQSGKTYNIIGFDPRGTALNMPYTCSEEPSGANAASYPGSTYPAAGTKAEIGAWFENNYKYYKAVGAQCAQEQPELGRIISTIQTAQDVFAIAQAVGTADDKKIRYWGYSYGTLLGNVVARLYPDLIDRMVLDGNIDPNSYFFGPSYVEASDVVRGTEHFFQMCAEAKAGNCPWTALNLPQGATTAETTANMLKKYNDWVGNEPLAPKRGRTSSISDEDSFKVRDLMHDTLKTSGYKAAAQTLEDWYTGKTKIGTKAKRQDDGSFDPKDAAEAEKTLIKNNLGGIRCVDNELRPSDLSGEYYQQWYTEFAKINRYSPDISSSYIFSCAPWELQPTQNWGGVPWGGIRTNQSILFLQTYYDSVTPQQSAKNASSYYSNSMIAYTNGVGHCTDANPSADLNKALVAYWATAAKPEQIEYAVDVQNVFDNTDVTSGPTVASQEQSETLPDQQQSTTTKRDLSYLFEHGANEVKALLSPRSGVFYRRATAPVRVVIKNNAYCRSNQTSSTNSTSTITSATTSQTLTTTPAVNSSVTVTTKAGSNATTSETTATGSTTALTSGSTVSPGTITSGSSTAMPTTGVTDTSSRSASTSLTSVAASGVSSSTSSSFGYTIGISSGSSTTMSTSSRSQHGTFTASTTKATQGFGDAGATWNIWDPAKPSTSSTTTSWGSWTTKGSSDSWDVWTSQRDSVPATKTVCMTGARSCSTITVAIPTQTVYVDYFVDVCSTGITTKTVTLTATCNKGCDSKPTGVPSGYTTKSVYCTACAIPSTVVVTVSVTSSAQNGKPTTWTNVDPSSTTKKVDASSTWVQWSSATGSASSNGVKPTTAVSGDGAGWNTWAGSSSAAAVGAATGTAASASWGTWADATATGPKVAKYTGAAASNNIALCGSLFAAGIAGLWAL